jgi:hypothetical protein
MPVYDFFYRKRGLFFAIKAIFWHWLYYFYGGLALVLGTAQYLIKVFLKTIKRSEVENV